MNREREQRIEWTKRTQTKEITKKRINNEKKAPRNNRVRTEENRENKTIKTEEQKEPTTQHNIINMSFRYVCLLCVRKLHYISLSPFLLHYLSPFYQHFQFIYIFFISFRFFIIHLFLIIIFLLVLVFFLLLLNFIFIFPVFFYFLFISFISPFLLH